MNQAFGEHSFIGFVVNVHLKVIIYDMFLTTHDVFNRHDLTRLNSQRSDILVQHVYIVGVGGASGLHCLVTIAHGWLDK